MYTKMGMNKKTDNKFMDSIPYTPLDVERTKRINRQKKLFLYLNVV